MSTKTKNTPFDKYYYYQKSVQNADTEIEFMIKNFKKLKKRTPFLLREDFCGTGLISNTWAAKGSKYQAYGVDLDACPISYGKDNIQAKNHKNAQQRMTYIEGNVLTVDTPKVDICFAFNFSYFIFKERKILLKYFKKAYSNLKKDGVFYLDLFGGPDSQTLCEDIVDHGDFNYHWECKSFNPLTNDCVFAIHFKRKGEKKRDDVFEYHWRMWGMQELVDILTEAGFSKIHTFWEEDGEDGEGNGNFYITKDASNCPAWVSYIAAER